MTRRKLFNFPWRSRRRITDDVEHELAFHLQSRVNELVAGGVGAEEATAQARREFGDIDDARRYMVRIDREIESTQRRRDHVRALWQDVTYALRRMRSAPVFTVTALATLALGIGANTAVFSVVDAALLRPLPYPNADRVVSAFELAPWGPFVASPPDFADWRAQTRSFAEMSAIDPYPRTMTGRGDPRSTPAARVSHGFFAVFGVAPMLGRVFTAEEEQSGNTKFVILSHALWQQSFGGRRDVVGENVQLDGASFTIVGVMPPGFTYPARTELWTPLAFSSSELATQRGAHYLSVFALLKPGVTIDVAASDLRAVAARLAAAFPNTNKDYSASVTPLREYLVGGTPKRALLVLLVAVALVALIACANVANLVLARGTSRGREMAVRLALGATPRDLLYMALTESVLLALFGGAAGLLLAQGLAGVLDGLRPEALRQVGDLQIKWTAGAFTFLLSLIVGLLFGLGPGVQASRRRSLQPALQSGGRAELGERHTGRLRSTLVAVEIALAVILLSGAGLLIKSFARLQHVDPGFDGRNLLVFSVSLPDARYATPERMRLAYEDIVQRTAALPGVESAGAMMLLPLDGNSFSISTHSLDGRLIPPTEQPSTQIRVVTPDALNTLRVRLKSGRGFQSSDRAGAEPVVLVNESAARLLWKGVDPIGHSITIGTRFGADTTRARGTVVGVVSDIRDAALGTPPRATVYFPHAQASISDMTIVVRVAPSMDPMALVSSIRPQLQAVDPLLPMIAPRTMDEVADVSVAQPRFATLLMSAFAALAVLLAIIGVFGVMAYIVGQRTREIGIRMALGASQQRVVGETLARAAAPLIAGVAVGVTSTALLVRLMTKLLYDVQPHDPSILAGVAIGLVVVALLAAYFPARRASAIDPLLALRSD
jgi:putative ABC transport system permease protein